MRNPEPTIGRTQIGFDWLCSSGTSDWSYSHNPHIHKDLRPFSLLANWLCFAQSSHSHQGTKARISNSAFDIQTLPARAFYLLPFHFFLDNYPLLPILNSKLLILNSLDIYLTMEGPDIKQNPEKNHANLH